MPDLFTSSTAERRHVVILQPYHLQNEQTDSLYVTDAERLFTLPTDTPANQSFMARMIGGFVIERAISSSGSLGGETSLEPGEIQLANGDGKLDSWLADYAWAGRSVEVRIGALRDVDGASLPWSSWQTLFIGQIESVVPTSRELLTVRVRSNRYLQNSLVQSTVYGGWGSGIQFVPASSHEGRATAPVATLDLTSDISIEVICDLGLRPASEGTIIQKGTNFHLALNSSGNLLLRSAGAVVATSDPVTVNRFYHIRVITDFDLVEFFVNGAPAGQTTGFTQPVADTGADVVVGAGLDITIYELRVYDQEVGTAQAVENFNTPINPASPPSGLVALWKFNDTADAATALDDIGSADLTLLPAGPGAPSYVSSFKGDDPYEFASQTFGQTVPLAIGEPLNVTPKLVSSPDLDYQYNDSVESPSSYLASVFRAYDARVPLVPDITITPSSIELNVAGYIQITGAPDSFNDFRYFVPAQAEPPRSGHSIDLNSVTYEIDTISADYRRADLVSPPASTQNFTSEPISTTSGTANYTFQNPNAAIRLTGTETRTLTMDIKGWDDRGEFKASDAAGYAADEIGLLANLDTTDLVFDPDVGIYLTEPVSRKDLLDQIMQSVFGWWLYDRTGGLKIGNFPIENETPAGTVPRFTEAEIFEIEGVPGPVPNFKVSVGYSRNWTIQNQQLPGSVSAESRQFAADEYRVVTREDMAILDVYPTSEELPRFDTFILNRSDAETLATRLMTHYGTRRQFFTVLVNTPPLTVDLNEIVQVDYPRFGLNDAYLRVLRLEEDSARNETKMELIRWL